MACLTSENVLGWGSRVGNGSQSLVNRIPCCSKSRIYRVEPGERQSSLHLRENHHGGVGRRARYLCVRRRRLYAGMRNPGGCNPVARHSTCRRRETTLEAREKGTGEHVERAVRRIYGIVER